MKDEAARRALGNRVEDFLEHIPWYCVRGMKRLADDCGVCHSTISRLVHGQSQPSVRLAIAIHAAITRRLGVPLDIREIFSPDGRSYPTARVCDLVPTCHGCFPRRAYAEDGSLRDDFAGTNPGDWCTYPPPKRKPRHRPSSQAAAPDHTAAKPTNK